VKQKRILLWISVFLICGYVFLSNVKVADNTPQETKMNRCLHYRQVVYLYFYRPADADFKRIESELKFIEDGYGDDVCVLYVRADDVNEKKFRDKFKVLPDENVVIIVLPSGDIFSRLRQDDITKENLQKIFAGPCGEGVCGFGSI